MAQSAFSINVRKVGKKHVLYNHDAIAGDRLYRGDADKPRVVWPFKTPNWNTYDNLKDAQAAAIKLQTYLLKRDRIIKPDHYATSQKTKKSDA